MIPDWLYPAIECYGVLALAGVCLLYAFVLHMKMRALARSNRERCETLQDRLSRALDAISHLRWQLETAPRESSSAALSPGQALNLNKRGQVLRMQRRGEKPETIAGALCIPRNEVDLLLKVHRMAAEQVEAVPLL